MTAYYNENDPYAAEWLRSLIREGLIAPGDVDERSIEDVTAADLAGYTQCHFFAGIGGWSIALRLAGWPDDFPVWTGSCPCQPFSTATRGTGVGRRDTRHLWPDWFRLIFSANPSCVFGEQVASADDWLDEVWDDMEAKGFAFWPAILPAVCVGKDHIRERIYFVGHTYGDSQPIRAEHAEAQRVRWHHRYARELVRPDGIPPRRAALRAFGNAIVPQVAAEFVRAVM